jgi:NADPH2 dehydrogenase
MSPKNSKLFEPIRIGRIELSSRIVMGPLGSTLADENNVLDDSAREYYGQRARIPGTLIIGEATFVSPQAGGTTEPRAGIYTEDQINSWKRIVDSVHEAGSHIYLQLWALGRSADPACKARDGTGDVVSSSAVPQEGGPVPRAMTEEEIWTYVSDYATAAEVAVKIAGFDGVELHGGNNSLIDQFTQDVVNQREDGWGGSVEGRSRFGLEVTAAVCAAIGSDRVGYRISPFSTYQSMGMKDAVPQFCNLLAGLKALGIAYIHLVESRIAGRVDVVSQTMAFATFVSRRFDTLLACFVNTNVESQMYTDYFSL